MPRKHKTDFDRYQETFEKLQNEGIEVRIAYKFFNLQFKHAGIQFEAHNGVSRFPTEDIGSVRPSEIYSDKIVLYTSKGDLSFRIKKKYRDFVVYLIYQEYIEPYVDLEGWE